MTNIDAIAAVEGVDGVFIGPSDLSTDMGHFGNWRHPDVWAAIESAAASVRKAGKAPGILVGEADAQRCLDMGYLFVAVASDIGLLRAGDTIAAKFRR
jgi:4-hydroxy-2-oxoheptanedioate aldolase